MITSFPIPALGNRSLIRRNLYKTQILNYALFVIVDECQSGPQLILSYYSQHLHLFNYGVIFHMGSSHKFLVYISHSHLPEYLVQCTILSIILFRQSYVFQQNYCQEVGSGNNAAAKSNRAELIGETSK